jgi:hypothetical protein
MISCDIVLTVGAALCGRPSVKLLKRVATEGHPYNCSL